MEVWFVKDISDSWFFLAKWWVRGVRNEEDLRNEKWRKKKIGVCKSAAFVIYHNDSTCRRLCSKVWRGKTRGRMKEFAEGQVRRWEFESSGKCFQECLGLGSRVPLTTWEQKTTSAVKRRRRAGRVCRWHELTRRDVTWRDVTWRDVTWRRRGVEDASRWDGRSPRIPRVALRIPTLRFQQLPCQDNQSGNRWVLVLIIFIMTERALHR